MLVTLRFLLCFSLSLFGATKAGSSAHAAEVVHHTERGETISYAASAKRGDLAFTRQILGIDADQGDFGANVLMEKLRMIADLRGADLTDVLRLNVHLSNTSPELLEAAKKMIADHWERGKTPAVTFIPGRLPGDVPIACDAVIALDTSGDTVHPINQDAANLRFKIDAVIAPGNRDLIYASGRVAKGETYAQSVPAAVDLILHDYIYPNGAGLSDVVQVRAYVGDLDHWAEAEALIEKTFGDLVPPPIVFVEWSSQNSVEIEFIVAAPGKVEAEEGVTFFTPETLKASPVFSRVAIVHADRIIYFSGMMGTVDHSPEAEVTTLFDDLRRRSEAVGSNLQNLVKATYLVSDRDVDKAVNAVRPDYYDPARPPAASKIFRFSVGPDNRRLLIDMIAVPARVGSRKK